MFYIKEVPESLFERCEFHSKVYKDDSLLYTKVGECIGYLYLCQRFGEDNVTIRPYVLQLDESNMNESFIDGVLAYNGEQLHIFTQDSSDTGLYCNIQKEKIEEIKKDPKKHNIMCGSIDLEDRRYSIKVFKPFKYILDNDLLEEDGDNYKVNVNKIW